MPVGAHRCVDRRSGQMLVFTTLSLFFLFTVMGLTVDLGYSYYKKLETQAAADAAASAAAVYAANNGSTCGAGGVVCGTTYNCANPPVSPPVTPLEAGCLYAQSNGFLNTGTQAVSLIANNNAVPNEAGNSPSYWVQANVSEAVSNVFLYWAGSQSGSVASRAIAGLTTIPSASCIYVLDSTSNRMLKKAAESEERRQNCLRHHGKSVTCRPRWGRHSACQGFFSNLLRWARST